MKRFILAATIILSASAARAQPPALPEPIARANAGELQCYLPDTRRKTCGSLASYKRMDNGDIENVSISVITPTVTMEVSQPVLVKSGEVCGVTLQSQLDAAKFAANGKLLDVEQTQKLRERMGALFGKFFGHEMCVAFADLGRNLVATSTLDGVPIERLVMPVIWVHADEGYEVRP